MQFKTNSVAPHCNNIKLSIYYYLFVRCCQCCACFPPVSLLFTSLRSRQDCKTKQTELYLFTHKARSFMLYEYSKEDFIFQNFSIFSLTDSRCDFVYTHRSFSPVLARKQHKSPIASFSRSQLSIALVVFSGVRVSLLTIEQ